MHPIHVPRTNSNDDTCMLVQWLYTNGQQVQAGDVLAYLETSKATEELLSPETGILYDQAQVGGEYAAGSCIGYVRSDKEEAPLPLSPTHDDVAASFILTQDAQEQVKKYGVTNEQLASLGKKLLKKADILSLVNIPSPLEPLNPHVRNQAIVAQQVTLSHQSIPAAFAMIKIYCDAATRAIAHYIEHKGVMLGWTEVFISLLRQLQHDYPAFYQPENIRQQTQKVGIGVTIDVGTGLYIPVVKVVPTMTHGDIAAALMDFRFKALRRSLNTEDLSGGHLTISLHTDKDLLVAIPLIFPTQTCVLSLCAEQEELYLRSDNTVAVRHYLTLGIAYDHRSINGSAAVLFLQEIKRKFEGLQENSLL
jgi:2-oxoglutarate dehydrogenase E2 component (dihydrolipoamide succinyltransferase)